MSLSKDRGFVCLMATPSGGSVNTQLNKISHRHITSAFTPYGCFSTLMVEDLSVEITLWLLPSNWNMCSAPGRYFNHIFCVANCTGENPPKSYARINIVGLFLAN